MSAKERRYMHEQTVPLTETMVLLGGQTILYFLSCGLAAVGLVLIIIGVATPEWTAIEVEYIDKKILRNSKGLWRICKDDVCADIVKNKAVSLEVCEAFGLLAVLSGASCLSLLLAHLILQSFRKPSKKFLLTLATLGGILSAVFVTITASVWGAVHHTGGRNLYVGYSLILTVIGGILLPISGVLGCLTSRNNRF
ncbi:hypothetical protein Bpfe_029332 [Biomphalaria pfeifferi]|uniref:Claudin n=1 Tax=Biomphalaria pfeifferi TaxID=112525 RepID=A0AAD8EWE2_BIOPF|nr:hypothetical protein Bpfe_029332 [Biomphalaria pfeifferi]